MPHIDTIWIENHMPPADKTSEKSNVELKENSKSEDHFR